MIHLSALVHRQAEKYGDREALRYRDQASGQWQPISWRQFADQVTQVAHALIALGVGVQENVGTLSQNKPECHYIAFAAYAVRAVTVPLYATSSPLQVQYIVNDARLRYLFVGEQEQYDAALLVMGRCDTLQQIIIFDRSVRRDERDLTSVYFDEFLRLGEGLPHREELARRMAAACPEDLADILYTSGTTGEPKGVPLPHSCYLEAFRAHAISVPGISERDVVLEFLPLTHVFERAVAYICLERGATLCVNLRPQDVQQSLLEVRPTIMCSVPRFWEKVYQGVLAYIDRLSGWKRTMVQDAIRVGREHNLDYVRLGRTPPAALHLKYRLYERSVFHLLKRTVGVERGRIFPAAGAFVSDEVCEFMQSVGVPMIVGYGLTESTATVSVFRRTGYVVGSVGEVQPDLEVKIGENNEILLRGKTIFPGYYHRAEATAAAFDADGWFHTGDAGRLEGRTLFLTDRIKDLMKTSNGKYVCPQAMESKFIVDRYIDQVALIAEGRKFVSALIVPDYPAVEEYARQKGIRWHTREELLEHPKVQALFEARIDTMQQIFARYEQVKRFTLLPEPFSMERGELTNTLKLRRAVITRNYKGVIDRMYES